MKIVREGAEKVINTHGEEADVQNQLSNIVRALQELMIE